MFQSSSLIESLESRRLLTASATVTAAGVLTVEPFEGFRNTITVEAGSGVIDVSVVGKHGRTPLTFSTIIQLSGANVTVPTSIVVEGSQLADNIEVGVSSNLLLPTQVDGLGGNDVIEVGQQSATINGGFGNDSILAGNGADIVRGDAGNDTIVVGNGNDKIDGGDGKDIITAGDGNDIIRGGAAPDIIHAGNGNDTIYGEAGNDLIIAGNGNDALWGGLGRDTLDVGSGADTFGLILGKNIASGTGPDKYVVRSVASLDNQTTTYDPAKGDTFVVSSEEATPPVI
jgi:Ca2+-binding RTX toxin-like protein